MRFCRFQKVSRTSSKFEIFKFLVQFFFEWFQEGAKMIRIIALAFVMVQSQDESPWGFIFPDDVSNRYRK